MWKRYLIHARAVAEHAIKGQDKIFDYGITLYAKVAMFMTHILIADTDETIQMWLNLLQLTKKYNYGKSDSLLIANINTHLGVANIISNKIDSAKTYLNHAVSMYLIPPTKMTKKAHELINILRLIPLKKNNIPWLNEIKYDLGYALTQYGNLYNYSLGQYNEATLNYNKALTFFNEIEDIHVVKYNKTDTLYNVGNAYVYLGDLILAEDVLKTAKKLADQAYDGHQQQAITYMALARFNHHIGAFNESNELFKSAYNIMCTTFSKEHFMLNTLKAELGRNAYMLGNITLAKELLEEALFHLNGLNFSYWRWFVTFYLGRVYEALGEHDKALNFTKESLTIAKEHYKEKLHDSMNYQISQAELWSNFKINKNFNLQYLEKALQLNIQLFGKNHYQTARYHYFLGQTLYNKQQVQQAINQYIMASTILKMEKVKHTNLVEFIQYDLQTIQKKLATLGHVELRNDN